MCPDEYSLRMNEQIYKKYLAIPNLFYILYAFLC